MSATAPVDFQFRLFVAGDSSRSRAAIDQARRLCSQLPEGRWRLDVVDVLTATEQAETDRILATPTLLCVTPFPKLRIVGALTDQARLDRFLLEFLPPSSRVM